MVLRKELEDDADKLEIYFDPATGAVTHVEVSDDDHHDHGNDTAEHDDGAGDDDDRV